MKTLGLVLMCVGGFLLGVLVGDLQPIRTIAIVGCALFIMCGAMLLGWASHNQYNCTETP